MGIAYCEECASLGKQGGMILDCIGFGLQTIHWQDIPLSYSQGCIPRLRSRNLALQIEHSSQHGGYENDEEGSSDEGSCNDEIYEEYSADEESDEGHDSSDEDHDIRDEGHASNEEAIGECNEGHDSPDEDNDGHDSSDECHENNEEAIDESNACLDEYNEHHYSSDKDKERR